MISYPPGQKEGALAPFFICAALSNIHQTYIAALDLDRILACNISYTYKAEIQTDPHYKLKL